MTTPTSTIIEKARAVVEAVTFDNSGFNGQGGNGGLLSRETIRAVDELRNALNSSPANPQGGTR